MPLYTSYSEETQTQIEEVPREYLELGWRWNLLLLLKDFGEEKFKLYFEEYADMVDDIGIGVVESFLDNFDIADISSCRWRLYGLYESGAEFAQQIAEDCGDVPRNLPSWIEIDWEKSWDNLDYDYVESTDGHIFSQNFLNHLKKWHTIGGLLLSTDYNKYIGAIKGRTKYRSYSNVSPLFIFLFIMNSGHHLPNSTIC